MLASLYSVGWVTLTIKSLPSLLLEKPDNARTEKADLTGIKEEEITAWIIGDTWTIKGERKAESEVKEEDYHCCEHSYGCFSYLIVLPSNVDAKKIKASYEDRVLEITLPKATEVKPKKMPVTVKKAGSAKKEEKASK